MCKGMMWNKTWIFSVKNFSKGAKDAIKISHTDSSFWSVCFLVSGPISRDGTSFIILHVFQALSHLATKVKRFGELPGAVVQAGLRLGLRYKEAPVLPLFTPESFFSSDDFIQKYLNW